MRHSSKSVSRIIVERQHIYSTGQYINVRIYTSSQLLRG